MPILQWLPNSNTRVCIGWTSPDSYNDSLILTQGLGIGELHLEF